MKQLTESLLVVIKTKDNTTKHITLNAAGDASGRKWTFNNDFDKPTIQASIKHGSNHFFITNGKLELCGDDTDTKELIKVIKEKDW